MALAGSVGDSLSSLCGRTSLLGAIANTVSPVALGAEAVGVTLCALELRVGDGGHVVDT